MYMYSMGMMPYMCGIQSPYDMGGNYHQNLKNRYGVGYEDFGHRPYLQPYPMAVVNFGQFEQQKESGIKRFFKKIFK